MTVNEATPAPNRLSSVQIGYIFAALTVVMWASAFAGIRAGLESYSPYSVALLRYLAASVVLLGYALITRMPLPDWRDLPGLTVTGLLGFTVYNVALNAGEVGVNAAVASFIVAAAPIFMALLAMIFFKERLKAWGWVGIVISMTGVTVVGAASGEGYEFNGYALLVLLAAIVQAMYSVGQKPLLKKYGALRFTTYAIWTGTVFLLIFIARFTARDTVCDTRRNMGGSLHGRVSRRDWLCVLVTGIGANARLGCREFSVSGSGIHDCHFVAVAR